MKFDLKSVPGNAEGLLILAASALGIYLVYRISQVDFNPFDKGSALRDWWDNLKLSPGSGVLNSTDQLDFFGNPIPTVDYLSLYTPTDLNKQQSDTAIAVIERNPSTSNIPGYAIPGKTILGGVFG